jgi:hypothetical protein
VSHITQTLLDDDPTLGCMLEFGDYYAFIDDDLELGYVHHHPPQLPLPSHKELWMEMPLGGATRPDRTTMANDYYRYDNRDEDMQLSGGF